jgi:uncharacterized membrane protein
MKPGIETMLVAYVLTAGVFFLIDLVWLGVAAKGLYDRHIGGLLRGRVNWTAAVIFYLVYIGGIQIFVLAPALADGSGLLPTALMGGLLGLFAYATFDLTALALLRGWSMSITVVDMAWGTVLTGSTAAVVLWLARSVFNLV